MAGFGERLRRQRELRGVKLEEIAESTKIGVRYLRALEDEDLPKLPGGIFSKGFVRAYARYLGIDEEEAIADFVHIAGENEAALPEPPPPPEKPQIEAHYSKWWLVLALLALLAVAFYYRGKSPRLTALVARVLHRNAAPPPAPLAAQPSTQPPVTAPSSLPPSATLAPSSGLAASSAAPQPEHAPPAAGAVVVELHTTQQAWVQWSVDDGPTQDAVFPANADKRLAGNARVRLKVGDAAAVQLTYNGKALAPLGNDRQVKTLTFTPEGVQE